MEIFDKNSADKIQSKKYKGIKVPSLMPIRVKTSSMYAVNFIALMQYTLLIERMRVIDILFDIEIRGSKSIDSTGRSRKHIMESRPVSAMGRAIERLKMKKNTAAYRVHHGKVGFLN